MLKNRIESIDVLRGLVIALMTIDHVREFFFMANPLPDPMNIEATPFWVFFSRWLAHFCAPIFVFLAGISAYLYGCKVSKKELSMFLLKRGIFLIILEITVINFAWTFSFPPSKIFLQVIWAIGISMVCLSAIIWLPRLAIAAVALFLIAGHHLLSGISFESGAGHYIWAILYDRNVLELTEDIKARTSYPVLPWIGIIALGYLYGCIFAKGFDAFRRNKILIISAILCFSLFIILRFGNIYGENNLFVSAEGDFILSLMSFFNLTKYPPSLLFSLMTLSGAFLCLRYIEKIHGVIKAVLLNFGRVPMFYYILHLYALHIAYKITVLLVGIEKYSVSNIQIVWIISIITLIALYPAVIWFGKLKASSDNKLLKYL
ncbi:MAG: hypothetical protein COV35_01675 [Alphaproteobacteria bacterium CG11_big_fil_rev_8_21_14_0_20_39_49]|nr:MAG: hypothetical protein COV35_01675 [Alphaproteobacteria bacterium CG11_big_fil_rev_8_21_14_0_20_39_49]